jgi:NADH-quinone oxidoreductase subunit N
VIVTDLILFLPELYLALTAVGLVLGEVGYHGERVRMILATALLSVGGAGLQLLLNYAAGAGRYGHGNFVNDGFSLFLKVILLAAAGVALIADRKSHEASIEQRTEHAALVLGATAFGMLAVSAASWLWILPLLFAVQIIGSLLLAMKKLDFRAVESAFKGSISAISALLLLSVGALLFYSVTGEFDLYRIHERLLETTVSSRLYATGFCLILVAIGFFGTYFPAQLWAKDAYEGASLPTTSFVAALFRITSFGVLIRVIVIQFSKESEIRGIWLPMTGIDWTPVIATVAGVTLVMGALYSFRQTDTRKLFSGVMVFQSGFYLLGILALDQIGFASILFGLLSEVFMVAGLFTALAFFEDRSDKEAGPGRLSRSVPEGVALLLFLVCVVGLPPLPGFLSKFTLVSAASRHGWNGLALIALCSLALVAVAAFRWIYPWIGTMRYKNEIFPISWSHRFLLVGLVLPLLLISVFAESALRWVGSSVSFLLW